MGFEVAIGDEGTLGHDVPRSAAEKRGVALAIVRFAPRREPCHDAGMLAKPSAAVLSLSAVTALLSVVPAACSRKGGEAALGDAGPIASAAAPPEPPASAAEARPDLLDPPDESPPARDAETPRRPLEAAEPRRTTLRRLEDDRTLRPHGELLRAHFGGSIPAPIEIQVTPVGGERRAILVTGGAVDRRPFLFVLDAEDRVVWTKERPLAGIAPGVREIVVLPGPDGQVAISWFDVPTKLVALRVWDATGGILADFQLFSIESGDTLSALYWPGRGFLVVAAEARGAARAQLLDESGRLAWGQGGKALPWVSRAGAPVAIAVDTESSVVLVQVGDAVKAPAGDPGHALAGRYDARGAALWDRPIDLGPVTPQAGGHAALRPSVTRASDGVVRVSIPSGGSRRALEINAVGVVSAARAR
jgi:hypothetical protein